VDKRFITGFPPIKRIYYINIVLYNVFILYKRKRDAKINIMIRNLSKLIVY